ncbi:hypothetical protein [Pseudomonas moorei]|uniref:hypothetical protein n=1 Tax=Pseudomonas moorei TaxID=395599 RepID=UPI001FF557C0|nr:hypothetical protein [Pseudomonas moorei]
MIVRQEPVPRYKRSAVIEDTSVFFSISEDMGVGIFPSVCFLTCCKGVRMFRTLSIICWQPMPIFVLHAGRRRMAGSPIGGICETGDARLVCADDDCEMILMDQR